MDKLRGIRTVSAHPGSAGALFGSAAGSDDDNDTWVEGTSNKGNVEKSIKGTKSKAVKLHGREPPTIAKTGTTDPSGTAAVDPAGGEGQRPRPRGGFRVDYRELADTQVRSNYDKTTLTILINLDHPAVKNALRSGGVEDASFRRLSYEIAFTEYAMALGREMIERDPDMPADDALYEVRSTLNRVAASAASLYS